MVANIDLQRLKTAAEFVREGRSLSVGDVLLSSDNGDTLLVTGWTRSTSIAHMTRQSALNELSEVSDIFEKMLMICPDLIKLTDKKNIVICLGLDYGMGAIRICSQANGTIHWEVDLKE